MMPTRPTILDAYGVPVGEVTTILDAQGIPMIAGRIIPQETHRPGSVWTHDDESPTAECWARYGDWRKTKCLPRDLSSVSGRTEEINQALHEFIGEVAELGELIYKEQIGTLTAEEPRRKLIDEMGDIFFCGMWALDAFGPNPLREEGHDDPSRLIEPARRLHGLHVAELLGKGEPPPPDRARIMSLLFQFGWAMSIYSGMLSNSFKKSVYQRRHQPLEDQIRRVLETMSVGAHLLYMAGSSPVEALEANIAKLDHRYPDGYQGPGGGIRSGKGAGSEVG